MGNTSGWGRRLTHLWRNRSGKGKVFMIRSSSFAAARRWPKECGFVGKSAEIYFSTFFRMRKMRFLL